MTLLEDPRSDATDATDAATDDTAHDTTEEARRHDDEPVRTADGRVIEPGGRIAFRGMRIRRVRLKSVAKISFVFWLLAFGVFLGTVVAVWNVAQAFGYVESFEETMITSLGLESFEIDGGGVFGVVATGIAVLCALGWLTTLALAAVYNAACGALGGLAVETGPLHRRRRVFSWRHRGFVTITE
ncbi:MAG: DUF3566 domain-containing protein [Acidimicrobiia bacterium]